MAGRAGTLWVMVGVLLAVCACQGPLAAPDDAVTTSGQARHDYCAAAATDTLACVPASPALFVALQQTTIMLAPDVAVHIDHLNGRLAPKHSEAAVILDDLSQFAVQVHTGHVHLPTKALAALVHHALANEAAIRGLTLTQQGRRLVLDGEFRRRGWVAFHLTGQLSRLSDSRLVLRPSQLSVDGRPAMALMQAAHLRLADMISLNTPALTVRGNQIEIDVPALLPAPEIDFVIRQAGLDTRGLNMTFDDGHITPDVSPARPAESYVLLHGGRLAIGPLHTADPRIQLASAETNRPLVLSLADYRSQLAGGRIELLSEPERATFVVQLAAPEPAS